MPSPFLLVSSLQSLSADRASNAAYDLARVQVRDQLAWLHERLYPEIRTLRWDVHYRQGWSLSPAQVSQDAPRIDAILLRYTKAETSVRMMQKRFGLPTVTLDDLATLGVRVDARGLAVEFAIRARSLMDALNLHEKLVSGAPEKRALRQIFAELGGEFSLTLREANAGLVNVRCSRLVDLRVLNALLDKFTPGLHDLTVTCAYAPDHPRLDGESIVNEMMHRLTRLYALYQFGVWSPRNNYARGEEDESVSKRTLDS